MIIQKPQGFDEAQVFEAGRKLPAGGYVLRIEGVDTKPYDWGTQMVLYVDIAEGEYKGYFKNNYANQPDEHKKWKGAYRLTLPEGNGADYDKSRVSKLKGMVTAIEESNNGFRWDWNDQSLVGKYVGGLFGRKEYSFDGKEGFYTDLRRLCSVDRIKTGNYEVPTDWLLEKKEDNAGVFGSFMLAEEELPF